MNCHSVGIPKGRAIREYLPVRTRSIRGLAVLFRTHVIAFDHAKGTGQEDKFEAVSSVYRLRQSRCFLQSQGKLTCESCHNPHRTLRGTEAVKHYSATYRQCHAGMEALAAEGKHSPSTDCAGCHMPKRRAQDTPGMVMTDHLIQRRRPAGDLLAVFREPAPEEYLRPVVPYYRSPWPPSAANAMYVAAAQVGLWGSYRKRLRPMSTHSSWSRVR